MGTPRLAKRVPQNVMRRPYREMNLEAMLNEYRRAAERHKRAKDRLEDLLTEAENRIEVLLATIDKQLEQIDELKKELEEVSNL